MLIKEEDYLKHIGTPRKSGRYPWGSGDDDSITTRNMSFTDTTIYLKRQGVSEKDIAKGMGISMNDVRARKSIEKNAAKQADINMARRLRDKGMSPGEIGKRMAKNGRPRNESSVRALLEPGAKDKADQLMSISNMLKRQVDEKGYIQVGVGVENWITPSGDAGLKVGISPDKLKIAVAVLKNQGYAEHSIQVPQPGTSSGNMTTIKVIAPPGTKYADVKNNPGKIHHITEYSKDGGRTSLGIKPPIQVSSKRLVIKYREDGGDKSDGVVHVRPGIKDLSLGANSYAQVRIAVDGTHYIKGMAIYKDDLPKGVDLLFHTAKSKSDLGPNKVDALKKNGPDKENTFTSWIKHQIGYKDENGDLVVTSAMNLVNEEGDWLRWSKDVSSQMLSKQHPALAKEQLGKKLEKKQADLDELLSLTNPVVRKKLLETYAESADHSAMHLEAASFKGQGHHIILPVGSLKDNEVYAPNFDNGTQVVLIRHPHAGLFEIPELTVNNKHPESRRILGDRPQDAIGINTNVAKKLSGADFDGDTVLVIPNNNRKIESKPALAKLMSFDPQHEYPGFDGMPVMTPEIKGFEMGKISNLITDMSIKGASKEEIVRAVKHSMVVIDAEKHGLNYRQSALDNGIAQLKRDYQKGPRSGADTLISKAGAQIRVPRRKASRQDVGGPIDKATGEKRFTPTGETYTKYKQRIDPSTGKKVNIEGTGKIVPREQQSNKMAETTNAFTLSSRTVMESVYAEHANGMKALANKARKVAVNTERTKVEPSATIAYRPEVDSLNAQLSIAVRNKPLERLAQAHAYAKLTAIKQADPSMSKDELKKLEYRVLEECRTRVGAKKHPVVITDNEWAAIQAGAITNQKLKDILDNTDLDAIKQRAMPRTKTVMPAAVQVRARAMLARGNTRAEVAKALGVSLTTLRTSLDPSTEGG